MTVGIGAYIALLLAYLLLAFNFLHNFKRNEKLIFRNWELESVLWQALKYLQRDYYLKSERDNNESDLIKNILELLSGESEND